jgi:hypothetical protein
MSAGRTIAFKSGIGKPDHAVNNVVVLVEKRQRKKNREEKRQNTN